MSDEPAAQVAALPTTSVAEFRAAAWPLLYENYIGQIVMRLYFTWAGLGGAVSLLAFGLAGLAVTAKSWSLVAAGLLATGLVVRRLRRQFRRGAAVRRAIDARSREVDSLAARGQIPLSPSGWDAGVMSAPHERTTSWV